MARRAHAPVALAVVVVRLPAHLAVAHDGDDGKHEDHADDDHRDVSALEYEAPCEVCLRWVVAGACAGLGACEGDGSEEGDEEA